MNTHPRINTLTYFAIFAAVMIWGHYSPKAAQATENDNTISDEKIEEQLTELSTSIQTLTSTVGTLVKTKAGEAKDRATKDTKDTLTALESKLNQLTTDLESGTTKLKNKSRSKFADATKGLAAKIDSLSQMLSSEENEEVKNKESGKKATSSKN